MDRARLSEDSPVPSPPPEDRERGQGRRVARWIALLAGILAMAVGLRVYRINEKSFWTDEFISAELACGRGQVVLPSDVIIERPMNVFDLDAAEPVWKVWFARGAVNMPPLYVMLTRLWGEVFGMGEMSLRGFACAMSVAAVAAMFFVVRELSGPTAGLWAAALMAFAGPQIQYAQEARHYTLLLLEGLIAAWALVRIEKRGATRWRCVVLAVAVAAMALTHYFSLGAIVALAVYAVARLRGRTRVAALISFAGAGVAWLGLGLPVAIEQLGSVNDPRFTDFLKDGSTNHLARTALRAGLLPVRFFTEPMGNVVAPAAIGTVAYVLIITLAWRRRELLLWALWLWCIVLPVVVLDAFRRTQHLEFIRYTLLASPALYALVAGALGDRKAWMKHVVPLLAVIACVAALPAAYSAWWKADWRRFAQAIDAAARPGELVIFWRGEDYAAYPNDAYLHTSYYGERRTSGSRC
jgi:uncharacterized membrane protein